MGKVYKFNEKEIINIIEMYVEHFESTNIIAKKYDVDNSVIIKRLKDNGVKVPKGSAYSEKYWDERGMKKNEIKNHIKTLRPVNKEYWIKLGYSEEDSILQIEGQKLVSLRGCIARFGEIEGTKKWISRKEKRSVAGKKGSAGLEYWINKGYSLDEAKIKRRERQQTFSKKICIEKYGKEGGLKVFTERQNRWQKTLYKNGKLKSGYSEISQELFFNLIKNIDDIELLNKIYFAKKGGEYVISNVDGFFRFDFTDIKNKKIIEYNGDQYHGNPKKYLAEDTPHPFRKDVKSKELWEKDMLKNKLANKNGFEVLTIWDSEYRLGNKQKVINKCIKFLNYEGK
jgi:hypothetical protein